MIPEAFVYLSIPIGLIGVFLYMRDMVYGKVRPNRVSFLLWSLAPFIGTAVAFYRGAGIAILPVFLAGLNPFIILVGSFFTKNGYWKLSRLDYVCGFFALLALVFWLLADLPTLATFFAVLSDLLAGIPTLVKSWKDPESESWTLYGYGIVTNALGLLVLTEWSFVSAAFGTYLIFMNTLFVIVILRKQAKKRAGERG